MKHDEQCFKNQTARDLGVGGDLASCTCGLDALLRVARVVKAWINLYNDGPLPNFASWREAEKEIEAALKEVEHLL